MLNMKDVYVAGERYEDIRRTAEKHNAAARMVAKERTNARALHRKTQYKDLGSCAQCLALRRTYVVVKSVGCQPPDA